ncbi:MULTISPECIES: thiopurine S-methyltransferase [unclassified Herbaspirillum]|uniref:thiopurine S-methyltransferase n=1 Tax=unclassified Herbaspirillum TaxID=2624150 RepID=UPI00161FF293|nr:MULTISPECIES: thiopurine S-methyltransferase [unclassified Herbaspirillum]
MHAEFWLERWRDGRTHFHQDKVMPLLQKYWPVLGLPAGSQVLVPLAGKSLDMLWLAAQGHRVLGIELSEVAVEQFFSEHGLHPEKRTLPFGVSYHSDNIELLCADIFAVPPSVFAQCEAVYDRAALIALPPAMRAQYAQQVYAQLPPGYRGMLITLDYPQQQMDGPPFSVPDAEVQALMAAHSQAIVLDQRAILDKEPKFSERGVTRLDTLLYQLQGKR